MRRMPDQKHPPRRAAALLLCILLLCAAGRCVLLARAERAAPAGSTMERPVFAEQGRFPLETAEWRVSDAYGWRADPLTGENAFHRGVDLACAGGTRVLAAMDGVVTAARQSASYGNYLLITHDAGQQTLYAHLQYLYVRAGEVVAAGQPLGTVGQTGRATGAHLHFELLVQGIRQDPARALGLAG